MPPILLVAGVPHPFNPSIALLLLNSDVHTRKIQIFNEAEIGMFTKAGLNPVFFADTMIVTRIPNLTYMLTFADLPTLTAHWAGFSDDPAWKELSHRPSNTDAEIVSNIRTCI